MRSSHRGRIFWFLLSHGLRFSPQWWKSRREYSFGASFSRVITRGLSFLGRLLSRRALSGFSLLNYRISQLAAQFVGKDAKERKEIFSSVKEMYSRRSKLVHGAYDVEKYDKGEFVTADEVDRWAVYLRRAYLGFMTLYLSAYLAGKKAEPREPILEAIAETNFDDAAGEKLRGEADIEKLLAALLADFSPVA